MYTETKNAVEAAIKYFGDVLPATDIRLEEIELSDDERFSLVSGKVLYEKL